MKGAPEFGVLLEEYTASFPTSPFGEKLSGEFDKSISYYRQDNLNPLEWYQETHHYTLRIRDLSSGPVTIGNVWDALLSRDNSQAIATEGLTICTGVGLKLEGDSKPAVLIAHIPDHIKKSLESLRDFVQKKGFRIITAAISTRRPEEVNLLADILETGIPFFDYRPEETSRAMVARIDGIALFQTVKNAPFRYYPISSHTW